MSGKCKNCYSYAINPHEHGRDREDLDLCDVCYWRKRATKTEPSSDTPITDAMAKRCSEDDDCSAAIAQCRRFEAQLTAAREALEPLVEMYEEALSNENVDHELAYLIFWKGERKRWEAARATLTQLKP